MGDRTELLGKLREAAAPLRGIDERKMFGCEALFTNGSIFALVWKTGRIGVKLPDASRFDALAAQKGAEPWKAGPTVIAHWLLVPPALERDTKKLAPWVEEAHAFAAAGVTGEKATRKAIDKVTRANAKQKQKQTRAAARNGKDDTKMANSKKQSDGQQQLAGDPGSAMTVAAEVVQSVKRAAKAAADTAKSVIDKATKTVAGAKKKAGGAAKKKAGAAKKKAGAVKKKAASAAKKAAGAAKKAASGAKKKAGGAKKKKAGAKKK